MTTARELVLQTLRLEQAGGVLTASYESPPHNFMNLAFARDWDRLTRAVGTDASVGCVILTGAPPDRFLTHFDVAELAAAGRTPVPPMSPAFASFVVRLGVGTLRVPGGRPAWRRFGGPLGAALEGLSRLHASILRMQRSGVVYLAAINGPCLGGGLELALACDIRIAADADVVRLGPVEVLGGIIPGAGGTQHLPRLLGTARALELLLDGGTLGAKEALEAGLVSQVAPAADLLGRAGALAERYARRSRVAVAAAKRAVYTGASLPLARGLYVEAGGLVLAGTSPEARRMSAAFAADLERLGDSPFVVDGTAWQEGTR